MARILNVTVLVPPGGSPPSRQPICLLSSTAPPSVADTNSNPAGRAAHSCTGSVAAVPGLASSTANVGSPLTRQRLGPVCLRASSGSTRVRAAFAVSGGAASAVAVSIRACGPAFSPVTPSRLRVRVSPAFSPGRSASITWPDGCANPSLNLACSFTTAAVPVPVLASLIWNGTLSPTRTVSGPATAMVTRGRVTFTRLSTADE